MSFSLKAAYISTIPGMLKITEFLLVLIVVFTVRFGSGGHVIGIEKVGDNTYTWYKELEGITFFVTGASFGFAVIIPAIIISYLLGASITIFEFIINLMGSIFFVSMGGAVFGKIDDYEMANHDDFPKEVGAVGVLSIILGILFVVDFIYLFVRNRDKLN